MESLNGVNPQSMIPKQHPILRPNTTHTHFLKICSDTSVYDGFATYESNTVLKNIPHEDNNEQSLTRLREVQVRYLAYSFFLTLLYLYR